MISNFTYKFEILHQYSLLVLADIELALFFVHWKWQQNITFPNSRAFKMNINCKINQQYFKLLWSFSLLGISIFLVVVS